MQNVIVFNKSTIQRCRIQNTIIDKHVHLSNMEIGYDEDHDRQRGIYVDPMSKIRVVPKHYDFAVSWFNQDKTIIYQP
jgi:ADP-glucose pyrophosphorylase